MGLYLGESVEAKTKNTPCATFLRGIRNSYYSYLRGIKIQSIEAYDLYLSSSTQFSCGFRRPCTMRRTANHTTPAITVLNGVLPPVGEEYFLQYLTHSDPAGSVGHFTKPVSAASPTHHFGMLAPNSPLHSISSPMHSTRTQPFQRLLSYLFWPHSLPYACFTVSSLYGLFSTVSIPTV